MLFLSLFLLHVIVSPLPVTVNTDSGPITGTSNDVATAFFGVPYAAPPLGDLRFKHPQPVNHWTSPLDATQQKAGCIQACTLPPLFCPPTQSEDCLFVNVFAPKDAANLPVFVFIHGGNYRQGFNGGSLMDLHAMANATNAIYVVPQYRLGALGFLYANGAGLKGNFGILDQRASLQWIQRNIKQFGGDPTRVTIAGQSAGGCSAMLHMLDTNAKGLFHQVFVESSACVSLPLRSPASAEALGFAFMQQVGCSDLTCLMAKSTDEIVTAQLAAANKIWVNTGHLLELFQPFEPTFGTEDTSITGQPLDMIHQGAFPHVPLIAGATTDEAVPFVYATFGTPMPLVEARALLDVIFGFNTGNKLLQQYPVTDADKQDAREWVIQIVTDFLFTCPTRNMTQVFAQAGVPAFMYRYAHVSPEGPVVWGDEYKFCWDRACHAAEIPFFYDTTKLITGEVTPGEEVLTRWMSTYVGNFVHNSDPNSDGTDVPKWPEQGQRPVDLHLDASETAASAVPDYVSRASFCDFWDAIGYQTH